MTDLEIVIQRSQKVFDKTSADPSDLARRFDMLGLGYRDRYRKTEVMIDFEIVIQRFREAVNRKIR